MKVRTRLARRKPFFAVLMAAMLVGIAGAMLAFPSPVARAETSSRQGTYQFLALFGDVFERVRRDYVEDVTDQELIEFAINGMLTSLDPHSSYLNAKSFRDMQVQTRGEFGGLGIEVSMENGLVKIVSPIDDTPAFRAGLKPGDYIVRLDGQQILGMTLQDAVDKMRGKVGSKVVLTIKRRELEPFDLTLVRDIIHIQPVRARIEGKEGDIGYIRLTAFNENTIVSLEESVENLHKEAGTNKIRGFILDLRNNPGGLFDQAVAVADAFLDAGEIVSTYPRRRDEVQRYNAKKGDIVGGLPLVVMINDGSASSSEIVAGALQDHIRADIVGTKSFGKGSVQTIIPLAGHGAMRLTTARYFTPNGRSIQAVGIVPNFPVKQISPSAKTHQRRSEADLPNALSNPDVNQRNKRHSLDTSPGDVKETHAVPAEKKSDINDYQLKHALDVLRGKIREHQRQQSSHLQ